MGDGRTAQGTGGALTKMIYIDSSSLLKPLWEEAESEAIAEVGGLGDGAGMPEVFEVDFGFAHADVGAQEDRHEDTEDGGKDEEARKVAVIAAGGDSILGHQTTDEDEGKDGGGEEQHDEAVFAPAFPEDGEAV